MAEYLEREEAINALKTDVMGGLNYERILNSIPAADVQPVKHGKWKLAEDGWYCTACELYPPFDCDPEEKGIPYCPYCGAKMDGEDNG